MDDFKHESSEGDTITEFASGGPKSYGYGYQTRQGKQECKVRGISLNSEGSKQLNFNVLKQNVKDDILLPLATGVSQTEVLKALLKAEVLTLCVEPKITALKQCANQKVSNNV